MRFLVSLNNVSTCGVQFESLLDDVFIRTTMHIQGQEMIMSARSAGWRSPVFTDDLWCSLSVLLPWCMGVRVRKVRSPRSIFFVPIFRRY